MGERTAIEWATATWNPWHGCTKVSPGCKHCYMYREKKQYGQDPYVVVRSKTTFTAPLKWNAPQRVFTCSWSDWFHETADAWRPEAWDVIRRTPQHTYLILTKRPERIREHLPPLWGFRGWPNVWLGVSVESADYTWRITELIAVPAVVHFLSLEPLLGPFEIWPWLKRGGVYGVEWVIVGGESGPQARPMELAWARSLRDECVRGRIPFFLKQLGGTGDKRGGDAAVLDGRRWTEFPA